MKRPLDGRTVKPLTIAPATGTLIDNYNMLRKANKAIMGIVAEVQGVRESKKNQSLLKDPGHGFEPDQKCRLLLDVN